MNLFKNRKFKEIFEDTGSENNYLTHFPELLHSTSLYNIVRENSRPHTSELLDEKKDDEPIIGQHLEKVIINGLNRIKYIPSDFLCNFDKLKLVILNELNGIKHIHDNLLYNCSNLEIAIINGLNKLSSLKNIQILHNCIKLKSVILSGLNKLKMINKVDQTQILINCINIETLVISGLNKVEYIKYDWLSECTKLNFIYIDGLKKLKTDTPSKENSFLRIIQNLKLDLARNRYILIKDCNRWIIREHFRTI